MILLIDNYDSFVYNLARYVRELGEVPVVRRHDAMTADDVLALAPSHVIISPGPCSPAEAGTRRCRISVAIPWSRPHISCSP